MSESGNRGERLQAAAVRELLKRGLAAVGFQSAASGAKSSEFSVIDVTPRDGSRR